MTQSNQPARAGEPKGPFRETPPSAMGKRLPAVAPAYFPPREPGFRQLFILHILMNLPILTGVIVGLPAGCVILFILHIVSGNSASRVAWWVTDINHGSLAVNQVGLAFYVVAMSFLLLVIKSAVRIETPLLVVSGVSRVRCLLTQLLFEAATGVLAIGMASLAERLLSAQAVSQDFGGVAPTPLGDLVPHLWFILLVGVVLVIGSGRAIYARHNRWNRTVSAAAACGLFAGMSLMVLLVMPGVSRQAPAPWFPLVMSLLIVVAVAELIGGLRAQLRIHIL